MNKASFETTKKLSADKLIFEKISSKINSHLKCILEMVESQQRISERPSTAEQEQNFYTNPIQNVFSHNNPSYGRVEKQTARDFP